MHTCLQANFDLVKSLERSCCRTLLKGVKICRDYDTHLSVPFHENVIQERSRIKSHDGLHDDFQVTGVDSPRLGIVQGLAARRTGGWKEVERTTLYDEGKVKNPMEIN